MKTATKSAAPRKAAKDHPDELTAQGERLVRFVLGHEILRSAIQEGVVVQINASADLGANALFENAATLEVNSEDASEALNAVESLKGELDVIVIHNALQFLRETRQFLGLCFSKLAIGGFIIISAPHQFLYERKLRLPSRRNPLHRRFYTPNTLLADVEEAIDPCECRVRVLADHDADYDYNEKLSREPRGGQEIVLALEKVAKPAWRPLMEQDEAWTQQPVAPVRYLEGNGPSDIRTIAPDRRSIRDIVLVKLDHRGDFMMAAEAFKIVREAFDLAEITLVCGSWNVAEARQMGLFNHVIALDFFPEDNSARQQSQPRDTIIKRFSKEISGKRYDLAVDLRLYDDTRDVLRAIKARKRAGFDRYNVFPWLDIRLNIPSATADDRAEYAVMKADRFATSSCKHLSYEIRADAPYRADEWRTLIWGPYQNLEPGMYEFECLVEPLAEDFEATFDMVFDHGRQGLLTGVLPISRAQRPKVHLTIDQKIEGFEFRIIAEPNRELKPFRFFGLRFVRPSVIRGAHQSEAMALLAHLVQMRLRNAYSTEVA